MSQVPPEARKGADWMPDESSKCCVQCKKEFTLFTRRHHCYADGRLLCADCTPSKCVIPVQIGGTSKNEVRVCADCKEWCEQVASGKYILRGTLLKAYEDYVLGMSSLSATQIDRLKTVTTLPDDFISGKKDARFSKITSINLKLFVSVREVGSSCFRGCSSLKSVDLKIFSNLNSLGDSFLEECPLLTKETYLDQVDLTPLARVPSIKDDWMKQRLAGHGIVIRGELLKAYENYVLGLGSLSKTQIAKLKTVTTLPDHFISGKKDARFKKITSINLEYFVSVQHVGNCLLEDCEQFRFDKEVLAPLLRASNIKDEWLRQVASGKFVLGGELLKAYEDYVLGDSSLFPGQIDQLKTVTTLPDHFIDGNNDARFKKITSVDLSMFIAVREIGSHFLSWCLSLQSINLKPLSNVTSVSSFFLHYCSSLQSIDLKPLSNVTSVSDYFLRDCSSLQSIDLKPLSNVTSVSSHFLYCCSSLQSIDLKPLSNVTSVDSYFLGRCSSLQSIDLKPLSNVTSVGSLFLSGCSSLQSIDLKPLSNVTSVSDYFLCDCSSLQSIDLKPLSNVISVDSFFLYGCSKLTNKEYLDQLDLTPLLHIPDGKIEIGFFEDKENLKKALQRVRAGGANGGPHKCVASSSSATSASSSSPSSSNSSGVAPAPTQKRDENDEREENSKNNSSGVQPAPERKNDSSGVAPASAKRDQEDELTENRRGRFDFNQEFETDQFDVAFDLPVFSPSYTPVHSARDAYAKVIGAIIGDDNKTQMTFTEVHKMLALVQTKTDALLQTVGKQHGQTQDEVFAIVAYSADVSRVNRALGNEHNFYYRLNNALGKRATADFSNHSPLLDLFCHFITGLRKIPAEKNITVYRAVSKSLAELSKKGAYQKVGASICWPALTSTSLDPKVSLGFVTKAQNCAALMKITVSQAFPIIEYSQFPYEQELLLLPNSRVKIDAVHLAVPRTASEITSFNFTGGALPNTIDVVEMSQQERSSSEVSNFPSSPTEKKQDVQKMDEEELCAFLKTQGIAAKILSILKEESVAGREFFQPDFMTENEDLFTSIRKTALQSLKELHAQLSSSSPSAIVQQTQQQQQQQQET